MTKKYIQVGRYKVPISSIEKWIAALRSGKYKQGKDRLYRVFYNSFCCLGVLEHEVNGRPLNVINDMAMFDFSQAFNNDFYKRTGLLLSSLNDSENKSFDDIADYLEWVYIWGVLE